ncbi:unnamed protein product [Paramecium sonneborni]|uniref:Uncharacterized protein n=1 Tax=Paramecium sonneborni TaxID=65129 RepID=A0A8S1MTD8_9CILI|nr:unnamed protein product [Paramecium sonneborni]
MSTIEKQIQKQRKLSNEFEYTYNSQETHSNSSFFDEERSQDFDNDNSSIEESFSDTWEMSSICTENSQNPRSIEENQKYRPIRQQASPNRTMKRDYPVKEGGEFVDSESNSKNCNSGECIAIDVLGHRSIGNTSKKDKKLQKLINKQVEEGNSNNNYWPQQQNQSHQISQHSIQLRQNNQFQQQRESVQESKQISKCQKVTLAYLVMEREVEKKAYTKAINFIQNYMSNCKQDEVIQMIAETYKVMLIPDQQLQQLASVLNKEDRLFQLNISLLRLNLPHNLHPFAVKADSKLRKCLLGY